MSGATCPVSTRREPELVGQTLVVIGGSAGIGPETARRARAEGVEVILTSRNPGRLAPAELEVGAQCTRGLRCQRRGVPGEVLPGPGQPDRPCDGHGWRPALRAPAGDGLSPGTPGDQRAHCAGARGRAPCRRQDEARGQAVLMGGTGVRRVGHGLGIASASTAALPPFTAALALELAPVRVSLIAAGFVDTPLSASLLGDRLEGRRNELRATLPIGLVGPADDAAPAVHILSNTALTGAT